MKKYKIYFVGLFLIILYSCYDDKGNYKYDWVEDFFVGKLESDTLNVKRGDVLSVDINIYKNIWNDNHTEIIDSVLWDSEHCIYEWSVFLGGGLQVSTREVISTKRGLDEPIYLTARDGYWMEYKIIDTLSQYTYVKKMTLNVVNQYVSGFFFLVEQEDGTSELELYAKTTNGSYIFEKNILESTGFDPRGGYPQFVNVQNYLIDATSRRIWVGTSTATGYLNLIDLSWNEDNLASMETAGDYNKDLSFDKTRRIGSNDLTSAAHYFFKEKGEVYFLGNQRYIIPNISYIGLEKLDLAPMVGGNGYAAIFYDRIKKRFVGYHSQSMGATVPDISCHVLNEESAAEGMELIYLQNVSTATNINAVAFLKDPIKNKYFRYDYKVGKQEGDPFKYTVNLQTKKELIWNSDFDNVDHFLIDEENGFLYAAKNNNIYVYREDGNNSRWQDVKITYESGVLKDGVPPLTNMDNIVVMHDENYGDVYKDTFFVLTYSENNGGNLYVFKTDSQESVNLRLVETITGIGNVKSMSYFGY